MADEVREREEMIEKIRIILKDANNIVCLTGVGTAIECGAPNFLADEKAYEIEDKYHYSPEEILSTGFYSARTEKFYDFYHQEVLSNELVPNEIYTALLELQNRGKLKACITQNVYGLSQKAGIENVIELHGNIYHNWCTKCGKKFSAEYMRNYKGVPLCDECHKVIRPGVRLYGEMIRNDVMTDAVNACQNADVLLILGTNIYDSLVRFNISHYPGDKLVLITKHEHFTDNQADYLIHDYVKDIMPLIVR